MQRNPETVCSRVSDWAFSSLKIPQRLARLFIALVLIAIALPVSFPSQSAGATGANPALIKDVVDQRSEMNAYASMSYGTSNYPDGVAILGNLSVFSALDPAYGTELFVTDGTNAGTRLLKDIENGSGSSNPSMFAVLGNYAYFQGTTAANGAELWRTDGTETGTKIVSDILVGISSSSPKFMTVMGDALYFSCNTSGIGTELYKMTYDAVTDSETVSLVKNINAAAASSNPGQFTVVNSTKMFFTAIDGVNGAELWVTDGTSGGTTLVKDITTADNTATNAPLTLTVFDAARILFWGYTAAAGYEPWVSDGTSAGTFMLRDIYTGTTTSRTSSAWSINVFDGVAYYWAAANAEFELWKTDGTSVGTVMTVDALAGQSNSGGRLWKFNNLLYYAGQCAGNSVTGVELCSYNPSTNTFALVKDIWPGTISGMTVDPITDDAGPSVPAVVVGSKFYFMGYTATHSQELWQSDGTSAGTVETKDINTRSTSGNTYSSNTKWFIPFRSGFLFSATTNGGSQANQPYFSDGTSVGTVSLEPPTNSNDGAYSGYTDSNMTSITFGAYTYFTSQIVGGGTTLFRTDGTTAGTTQLSSNLIGTNIGFGGLGRAGNYILMSASNGASGWEMYTYNTSTNASGFIDIVSGTTGTSPSSYFSFGNKALFLATTSAAGNELWITDGTAAGTSMVKDIEPGAGSSGVAKPSWYELNGRVYFWASTANNGIELWRTDGTSAGTEMFVETNSGAYNGNSGLLTVGSMASIGNNLVVCADDGTNGYEVRSIDTTATAPATQTMIKSLASFSTNGCIRGVTKFGNNVLFVGNNLTSNYELWITDGTAAGTTQVREINTSSAAFNTFGNMGDRDGHFVVANGTAYFSALSSGIEYKLWKTDGTSSGTVEVSNVPTIVNNAGATIFGMGGRVYFSGNTAEAGYEPWVSDGTSAGTFLIANLMAGKNPSNPAFFSETPSGKVFFMAKGTKVGIEPYLYDPTVAADGMAASATTTTMGASTTTTAATTSTSTTATTSSSTTTTTVRTTTTTTTVRATSTSTTLVAPTTTQAAATTSTPKLNLDPWELAELDDTVAEAPLVNVPAPKVLPVQEETLVTARPGTALAVVDGRVVHPTVKVGKAVIKVTVGGTTAVAVVRDTKGNALPLSEQHIILLTRGQVFDLRASGLRPNEIADLWIYSTPQFLGRATANQMGQLRTQFIVSKNVVLGAHHIVVSIKTKSGSELSIAFAANVIDKPSRFPVLASPVLWFALALGLIAYVIGRRRRSSELH